MSGKTLRVIAAVVAAAFIGLLIGLRVLAIPRDPVVALQPVPEKPAETLVVIVHGFAGDKSTHELRQVATETFPGAHLLVPDFDARFLSNADAYEITDEIENAIARWDAKHNYRRIVLIGHSAGGVLIRKAYVWAAKQDEDRRARLSTPRPWAGRVDRIVLLAALNRGWSFEQKPEKMPRLKYWMARIADPIARIAGAGRLVHSLERGHPYVADLRMQWMRTARAGNTAPVFQLLGGEDEIVVKDDSRDVAAGENFVFLDAGVKTRHADILQFHRGATDPDLAERGRIRLQALREALTMPREQLATRAADAAFARDPSVEHVIFIKHGIRDLGAWTKKFRDAIEARDPHTRVVTARYGLFPMASFLLFNARQAKVRQFVDEYTEIVAQYPKARISYFGHSNGTYLLASALDRYRTIYLHRVVFAGSVVRTDFPWDRYVPGRVGSVQNLVGSADGIVGIFPGFYQGIRKFFRASDTGFFDIGSAGFRGFEKSDHAINIEYVKGGHGAGFGPNDANVGPIADYLTGRTQEIKVVNPTNDVDGFVDQASKFSLLVWLLLVGGIVLIGWGLSRAWRPAVWIWVGLILLALNVV